MPYQIFQDNSLGGKYNITGFYAEGFGTFYQSCGNCLNQAKRNATIQNVVARDGLRMGIVSPPLPSSSPLLTNVRSTPTLATSSDSRTLRSTTSPVSVTRRSETTFRLFLTISAMDPMRSMLCIMRRGIILPSSRVRLSWLMSLRILMSGLRSFGLRVSTKFLEGAGQVLRLLFVVVSVASYA